MDTFDDGIKFVKYFIEELENYKIHIYYNEFDEKKIISELLNEQKLPENIYFMQEHVTEFAGEDRSLHLFYERNRYYGINADGTSHHFRLGVLLPEIVVKFLTNKYKNFKLMENRRLESGMQNKVFFIELLIKEAIKNKTNKS